MITRYRPPLIGFAITAVLLTMTTGIAALADSPVLTGRHGQHAPAAFVSSIRAIGEVSVDDRLFVKIPEFLRTADEANWFSMQRAVYEHLRDRRQVNIEYSDGIEAASVDALGWLPALAESGVIVMIALLLLLNATLVLWRHNSQQGLVLGLTIITTALYVLSAGMLSARPLVMAPAALTGLIWISYISSTGFLAFVYYAYIFPADDKLHGKARRCFIAAINTFVVASIMLYATGIAAYGSVAPAALGWVIVITSGFLHTLIKQQDRFLKKQLLLTLLVPLLAGVLFVFFSILPNSLRIAPLGFKYFAFVMLLACFVLSNSLDHIVVRRQPVQHRIDPAVQDQLTERQRQILDLLVQGYSTEKAATSLNISYETVRTHIKNMYRTLNVNSGRELVLLATGKLARPEQK